MKKIKYFLGILLASLALASCDKKATGTTNDNSDDNNTTTPVQLTAPVISLTDNVVSWTAVENATGYVVSKNNNEENVTATTYTIADTQAGEYTVKVKAVSSDTANFSSSVYSNSVTYTIEDKPVLTDTTLFMVGDSTGCDYIKSDGTHTDATYFYPRYGYGTQLANYFDSHVTVKNYAMSGRSSKSFLTENNYTKLKSEIKEGDYLLIGFGHNDEKNDDAERFTDASKPTTDPSSFKYSLYEKYVKLAQDKGATPILVTPIVRLDPNDSYTGSIVHDCSSKGIGNYAQAIIDLGTEKNVPVIDLTKATKDLYTSLTYNEAVYFHAMPQGKSATEPEIKSADATHINIYGAKEVAYLFADGLKNTSCSLKYYVKENIAAPTKATDLVKNPAYTYVAYTAFNWSTYSADSAFKTTTPGWYGTAFGDCGGAPAGKGFVAKEKTEGVFEVGQTASSASGKITSSADGFAFVFRQISIKDNFTLTADVKITTSASTKQSGFGLMLRDDCYAPNKVAIATNYVAAGIVTGDNNTANANFSRVTGSLVKDAAISTGYYAVNDTAQLSIERVGQVVKCKLIYKGTTYLTTYTDFDFVALDSDYMYVGMFATRGTVVEFTNVVYTKTGESQGA